MKFTRIITSILTGALLTLFSCVTFAAPTRPVAVNNNAAIRYLEKGQPPVVINFTVTQARSVRQAHGTHGGGGGGGGGGGSTNNVAYGGGTSGVGVETAPKIYLVFWGSQWNNNDPSGEAVLLQSFLNTIGASPWLNTVTQYCQGVRRGTEFCNGSGTPAGNPPYELAGSWYDSATAAPSSPTQSQFAAEAVRAAKYFGNTASGSNATTQYVIATANGYNSSGFGTQYCAWHSYTKSNYGDIAYTNLPYITDAGASCGAGFNGLGANAGISIVEGHEVAESITDQFPSSGWLDSNGLEIGD